LQELEGPSAYSKRFGYVLTGMMRSITGAMADGADLASKGPGYVLKKAVRNLLKDKHKHGYKTPLAALVAPSLACLERIGYTFGDVRERLETSLDHEENLYDKFHAQTMRFLQKQADLLAAGARGPVTVDELKEWRDSRGIFEDIAQSFLAERGHTVVGYVEPNFEQRRLFYSDGYQYDRSKRVDDVALFLHLLEKQYSSQ
jgi:alanyl-tRNA synthetase